MVFLNKGIEFPRFQLKLSNAVRYTELAVSEGDHSHNCKPANNILIVYAQPSNDQGRHRTLFVSFVSLFCFTLLCFVLFLNEII